MRTLSLQNLNRFLNGFVITFLLGALTLIFIRFFELFYIKKQIFTPYESDSFFSALNFDLYFWGVITLLTGLPLLALSLLAPRASLIIYRIFCALFLFTTMGLTHFFLTNNYLLSSEFLFFSLNDIGTVIATEFSAHRTILWGIYLILPLMILAHILISRKITLPKKLRNILLIIISLSLLSVLINYNSYLKTASHFKSTYAYYLGNNKIIYLCNSIYAYAESEKESKISDTELQAQIKKFHRVNKLKYISEEYPLLREGKPEDALGPYFKGSEKKPNIVLIISESLSSSFCGKYGQLGDLTPFLDSLADQGLYWRNFISNAERSYGALPNILASLPYGSHRGFNQLFENNTYPEHTSLIKILKKNGYRSSFYYGGWAYFDRMGHFLDYNGIDRLVSDYTFDKKKYDYDNGSHDKGYKWGYNDKDLFKHVIESIDTFPEDKPYFSIITTLSLHTPYNMCTKEYYELDYLKKRLASLSLDLSSVVAKLKQVPESQIASFGLDDAYNKKLITNLIATLFFTDDALRDFINAYKKRKDFDNTIFIITGDHNIGTLPLLNELDNYRVPLVIYSSLLKQHKEFPAVSSHNDIAPSLLALLNENYKLSIPEKQHWMGQGLDTFSTYRNRSIYSLNLYSQNFPNLFCKDHLVFNENVYRVKPNLLLEKSTDHSLNDSILGIWKTYKAINNYVCKENKISD